jgi:hypothetical protein
LGLNVRAYKESQEFRVGVNNSEVVKYLQRKDLALFFAVNAILKISNIKKLSTCYLLVSVYY